MTERPFTTDTASTGNDLGTLSADGNTAVKVPVFRREPGWGSTGEGGVGRGRSRDAGKCWSGQRYLVDGSRVKRSRLIFFPARSDVKSPPRRLCPSRLVAAKELASLAALAQLLEIVFGIAIGAAVREEQSW